MDKEVKDKLIGTLLVPVGLAVVLVPFSIFIGWNVLTLILFWFVLIPVLAIYLPTIVSRKKNHLFESSIGLIVFYAFMVFMIYEHYKTDYFRVMIFSGVINLALIYAFTWAKGTKAQVQ